MKKIEELIRPHIAHILPYPPGKPIKEVEEELGLKKIIKLASNENALGPSEKAIRAIRRALNEINLYPDSNASQLKEKLAKKYHVTEGEIFVGNGTDEIIRIVVETFLNPKEEVIVAWPAFIIYSIATQIMEGRLIKIPLKDYTHDLDRILDAVTDHTKLIFISNPNNPTGTIVDEYQVESFMKKVREDIIVVFDEAYYEYAEGDFPDTLKYIKERRNVITLRTFSKIYGLAGLRIGYGIAKKEIFSHMNRIRQPFNTNIIAQLGAGAALEDSEHVKRSKEMNEKGKNFFYKELSSLGLKYIPTSGNFILVDVKRNGKEIYEELLRKGVIIRPMDEYDLPFYIRVTIGKPSQNIRFIEVLKEMKVGGGV